MLYFLHHIIVYHSIVCDIELHYIELLYIYILVDTHLEHQTFSKCARAHTCSETSLRISVVETGMVVLVGARG